MAENETKSAGSDDQQPREPQPAGKKCEICGFTTSLQSEWLRHLWENHLLSEEAYLERVPGQPRPKVLDVATIGRVPPPPPPPPPPPERMVEIRLCPVESNPRQTSVECRPGRVYYFAKPTKGKPQWQEIPAPDAAMLLPLEGLPGRYAELRFEVKKPKKQPAKAEK